jgi:hypothetical protein
MEWVKATGIYGTGWVAGAEADTGWRGLTLSNGWAGYLYIRRIGNQVEVRSPYNGLNADGKTSNSPLALIPSGFQPSQTGNYGVLGTVCNHGAGDTVHSLLRDANGGLLIPAALGSGWNNLSLNGQWTTVNSWPTSLPGSPA